MWREDWKPVLTINSIIYGLQYLFLVNVWWHSFHLKSDMETAETSTAVRQATVMKCGANLVQTMLALWEGQSRFYCRKLHGIYTHRIFDLEVYLGSDESCSLPVRLWQYVVLSRLLIWALDVLLIKVNITEIVYKMQGPDSLSRTCSGNGRILDVYLKTFNSQSVQWLSSLTAVCCLLDTCWV